MKKFFQKLLTWWWNRKRIKKYSGLIYVNSILDIPEKLKNKIYIVKKEGSFKWVVFECACSKKNRIEVNLMRTRKPYWEIFILNDRVSLSPSVVVLNKCDCHFWMRENRAYKC